MTVTDKVFAGSIPEFYERYLVPLIFEPYARDLAKRLVGIQPRHVLETAAGTGVATRAIAARLPAPTRIVATDLNQPMLDHAKARQAEDGRIDWKPADAQALPFEEQSFDAVACQFGAMFFPDKVQGYKEARRVLKPGGRFIFNVWDKISENEFADVVTQTTGENFSGRSASLHGANAARPSRHGKSPRGLEVCRLFRDFCRAIDERSKALVAARSPPLPIARARRCEMKSRRAMHRACRRRQLGAAAKPSRARFGTGAVDGRIRAYVITAAR